MRKTNILIIVAFLSVLACEQSPKELKVWGRPEYVEKEVNGKFVIDTIPHTIDDFKFLNQDSSWVSNSTFKDNIYVADFFFHLMSFDLPDYEVPTHQDLQ